MPVMECPFNNRHKAKRGESVQKVGIQIKRNQNVIKKIIVNSNIWE